jgi:proline iminopeptidase
LTERSESRFLKVDGYRIYLRTFGGRNRGPTILGVHGGPGGTHDYLVPIADLTRLGYRVVLYDALGCGRSDLPEGTELYTMEHDLRVLDEVRASLGEDRIHLLGSSYGGMLALAYATRNSRRLRSLVSTGGLVDVPFTVREMHRLVRELPAATRATLRKYGVRGEYQHPEAAALVFYHRHVCRLRPWPEEVVSTLMRTSRPVYQTMNGPNEFTIVGNIHAIDFSDELPRISVPTLVIHGKYDEVTPEVGRRIQARIPGSTFHLFSRSSHLSFWEERAAYMRLVGGFLRSADRRAS